ncbi:glycosyltransferase family 4 protein [Yersinia enterocolitica]|nr:glycosyltransferase family 4 protein [Yersinia enterocolitica]HDZ9834031.1 glycosyltransferase family 4 protein [Yersinia enterocolitica]HEC1640652.1 glycosyltransferase family 4 protein [Yersinia enterocolitica]HEN3296759.1 glycosyltransferase family 4 protein [Yersinia enterocolitica]
MKILFIITKANEIGGAQTHIKDLCIRLQQDGHEPQVIVGETGALVDILHSYNIKVYIFPLLVREITPIKDIKCIFKLRKLIKEINPDIVTLHSSKAGIVGRLSLIGSGVPVVFTAHGWSFANGVSGNKKLIYIWIERICSLFTDKIITVSEQDKILAIKYKVAAEDKQVVIHNGIPEKTTLYEKENSECVRLISVARFCEQKDHETLLKALCLIKNSNWNITLIGKGPDFGKIKFLADELGLSSKIFFLGERLDVENLLSLSDVFLLISNWEGFPISILEAMRASLPVIASDVGGVNEAVKDNINGFLVNRKDVKDLAYKIEKLINDRHLRDTMGKQGECYFRNEFSFDVMYEKNLAIYKKVINNKLLNNNY